VINATNAAEAARRILSTTTDRRPEHYSQKNHIEDAELLLDFDSRQQEALASFEVRKK
jgi:hypothetical protein